MQNELDISRVTKIYKTPRRSMGVGRGNLIEHLPKNALPPPLLLLL